jgi:hypothetical protein
VFGAIVAWLLSFLGTERSPSRMGVG